MQVHARARVTPNGRRFVVGRVVEQGWSVRAAAEAAGVTERTLYRWLARFRELGEAGLVDRSSAPHRVPSRTPAGRVEAIRVLRLLRLTGSQIAQALRMPLSTVSAWLKRLGLGKRSRLEPLEPPNRYERPRPGELVHIDVKKLGRILKPGHRVTGNKRGQAKTHRNGKPVSLAGWECVHVAIDDHTRLAYAEVLADERAETAIGFLRRALAWFGRYGIKVERVMSDG
jgi:transposase